jgi:chromatin remodeling complex protein RSC6
MASKPTKPTKKPRASKTVKVPVPEPVPVATVPVPEPVPEPIPIDEGKLETIPEEPAEQKEGETQVKKKRVQKYADDLSGLISDLKSEVAKETLDKKALLSLVKKLEKVEVKISKVKKSPGKVPVQSGFSKLQIVSDEFAEFAGWDKGALKSRIDLNKSLCKYIKDHNLQDEKDGRIILPDKALAGVLHYGEDSGKLDFAQLQKYIGQHLTKVVTEIPAQ